MSNDFNPSDEAPSVVPAYITTLIRNAAMAASAGLVTHGTIDASTQQTIVGIVIGVVTLAWSLVSRYRANQALKNAIAAPAGKAE